MTNEDGTRAERLPLCATCEEEMPGDRWRGDDGEEHCSRECMLDARVDLLEHRAEKAKARVAELEGGTVYRAGYEAGWSRALESAALRINDMQGEAMARGNADEAIYLNDAQLAVRALASDSVGGGGGDDHAKTPSFVENTPKKADNTMETSGADDRGNRVGVPFATPAPDCRCPERAEGKHRLSCVRDQVVLPVTGEPPRSNEASQDAEDERIVGRAVAASTAKLRTRPMHRPQEAKPFQKGILLEEDCIEALKAAVEGRGEAPKVRAWLGAYVKEAIEEAIDHYVGENDVLHCLGCVHGDCRLKCAGIPRSDNALRDEDVQAVLWREAEIKAERNRLREELLDLKSTVRALWDASFASDDAALWDRLEKLVGYASGNRSGKAPQDGECEGDDWPPERVTKATAQARREGHSDALEACERICRERADEYVQNGQIAKAAAAEQCADEIVTFANTFKPSSQTGGEAKS